MTLIQTALDQGCTIDLSGHIVPPTEHPAMHWAAEWMKYGDYRVPHWLPEVVKFPFADMVEFELLLARRGHGKQKSLHEGYAVLLEEVDEFWDEVKAKNPDKKRLLAELVQIAAMAQRCAEDNDLL